jgi:hypothetical protein
MFAALKKKKKIGDRLIFFKMFVKVDNYPNKKLNNVRLWTFLFLFLFFRIMVALLLIFFREVNLFTNFFSNRTMNFLKEVF